MGFIERIRENKLVALKPMKNSHKLTREPQNKEETHNMSKKVILVRCGCTN